MPSLQVIFSVIFQVLHAISLQIILLFCVIPTPSRYVLSLQGNSQLLPITEFSLGYYGLSLQVNSQLLCAINDQLYYIVMYYQCKLSLSHY